VPFDPTILLLIVAAAGFYFLILRPNKKKQQAQRDMIASLQPGTEIMTTSGIFGTIAATSDDEFSVEISPGVFIRIVHGAVARVIEPAAPALADASADQAAQPDAAPQNPTDQPPVD
jgi:preprotein translocase subunit YajC